MNSELTNNSFCSTIGTQTKDKGALTVKQPIYTEAWGKCHIQGIAVDTKKGFAYYSFTTKLVKATLDGEIIGTVDGLLGHLGCIDFCEEDGRVYGSLEYKNDGIGKGILSALGVSTQLEDAFYIAIFDVDKLDRVGMDAEKDGIMTAVYLKEVVEDYKGTGKNRNGEEVPHRLGCSGIDGTGFGPIPGDPDGPQYLFVAYGVYGDLTREDNDHQVLLCFDTANWKQYEQPLSQHSMHKNGPSAPDRKFFVYTGNTTWGVQNLEYDAYQKAFLLAVYPGQKDAYPNYNLFAVDATVPPKKAPLKGLATEGEMLTLKPIGEHHEASNTWGWHFPYGSTGLYAFGNGEYLISENRTCQSGQCAYLFQYVWNGKEPFILKD